MDVQKGLFKIVALFFFTIASCESNINSKEVEVYKNEINLLQNEIRNLRSDASRNQKLLDNWFREFSDLQLELNSINTEEIILLEYRSNESLFDKERLNDKQIALRKIKKIKRLIHSKELELESEKLKYSGLNTLITNMKEEISYKEHIISSLSNENERIKERNRKISHELNNKREEVRDLNNELDCINTQLNKKYYLLVSAKECKVQEVTQDYVSFDYRFKDVEILSNHPENSYKIKRNGSKTRLIISNSNLFWKESNNIVIRIKKRRL
ncbi:MAG: hypothetical protein N4A71_06710 [Carboxylicivirga sp.]|jgi:chromosome segregation ATPase|nr:hypothetical protein [Carboxylicivirga sp.]